jgi:hypothetical protein
MTTPLPDPDKPNLIKPHPPQDDRDLWEIHEELPPQPYTEDPDELRQRVHGAPS